MIGSLLGKLNNSVLVPSVDSSDNTELRDVIGNKNDTVAGNTIISRLKIAEAYVHSQARVYPSLADGITITGHVTAWTLGAFAEVVPENAIDTNFIIDMIDVTAYSAVDVYEIVFYYGPTDIEAGRIRLSRASAAANVPGPNVIQTEIIPANSRIRAKVATKNGLSATLTLSINYHRVNI